MVYHNTVTVNDFRYLSPGLNPEPGLERPVVQQLSEAQVCAVATFAPMSGFLYVEPFEVRKEIIVRPKDIQRWIDLGLESANIIKASQRGVILEKVASFLVDKQPVTINGVVVDPILERANFLSRTLKSSLVVEPGIDINLDSAVVGVIFVYPTPELPSKATMTWDLFDERVQLVPAASVDEAGPLPIFLEPDYAVLTWENFLTNPTEPGLVALAPPPRPYQRWLFNLRWWVVALTIVLLSVLGKTQAAVYCFWCRSGDSDPGLFGAAGPSSGAAGSGHTGCRSRSAT